MRGECWLGVPQPTFKVAGHSTSRAGEGQMVIVLLPCSSPGKLQVAPPVKGELRGHSGSPGSTETLHWSSGTDTFMSGLSTIPSTFDLSLHPGSCPVSLTSSGILLPVISPATCPTVTPGFRIDPCLVPGRVVCEREHDRIFQEAQVGHFLFGVQYLV